MPRLYIGNLPFDVAERDVEALFAGVARMRTLTLIRDRVSGRCRGFGFADVDAEHQAQALKALNRTSLKGRRLRVELAKPAPERQHRDRPATQSRPSLRKHLKRGAKRRAPPEHRERAVLELPGNRTRR